MNVPLKPELSAPDVSGVDFGPSASASPQDAAEARGPRGGAPAPWWTQALSTAALAAISLAAACSSDSSRQEPIDPVVGAEVEDGKDKDEGEDAATDDWSAQLDPGAATKTSLREHELGEAWVIDPERLDAPRKLAIDQAEARGYTVINLGDSWRPYIFTHKTPGVEDFSENVYASHYTGLANDRVDNDGDTLAEHEHNYLELYGIPPSLSVVIDEWQSIPALEQCLEDAGYDRSVFDPSIGNIAFKKKAGSKRLRSWRWARTKLEKEMRSAGMGDAAAAKDYAAAAEHPDTKRAYEYFQTFDREVQVIRHAQIRFRCESLFNERDGQGKFTAGDYDSGTHHALANFEKKHDLMGWGHFKAENIAFLGRSPTEAVHQRLVRVLGERTISAAGVIEDGSARDWKPDFQFTDGEGESHGLRDLSGEYTEATLAALGLDDPQSALARLGELGELATAAEDAPEGAFGELLVAVRLPALPAYYSEDMAFDVVIDRGDIWYDFPWDDEGNKRGQPRKRYPHLTLYVTYEGQRIPLVHWRTTIGSWRTELIDGQEYYAYKNSDVGDRVWQTIMAAPVWIPPASTPTGSLTKLKNVDGRMRRVVNYDETGPGYKSAYGLVAAYHVKLHERKDGTITTYDNGIRTHGSVDYMSILRRFSHGCHRLYNMNAVRMFSMVLQHRSYTRKGQTTIGAGRSFEYKDRSYTMKLDTRGYEFELVEPIPVKVTEGRVRGSRTSPYTEPMPKPGVDYSEDEEELPPGEAPGEVEPSVPVGGF